MALPFFSDLPWLDRDGLFRVMIRAATHYEGETRHGRWAFIRIDARTVEHRPHRLNFKVQLPSEAQEKWGLKPADLCGLLYFLGYGHPGAWDELGEPVQDKWYLKYMELETRELHVIVRFLGMGTSRNGRPYGKYRLIGICDRIGRSMPDIIKGHDRPVEFADHLGGALVERPGSPDGPDRLLGTRAVSADGDDPVDFHLLPGVPAFGLNALDTDGDVSGGGDAVGFTIVRETDGWVQ